MKNNILRVFALFLALLALSGCSTVEEEAEKTEESATGTGVYSDVDLAEDYDSLLSAVKANLTTETYHSDEYNLDIPYGVYLPEDYDESKQYPLVMFIPDSSLAGKDVDAILEQGYGGVVWAAPEVQTGEPAVILYPAYPDVTVDDHNGYTVTDYVPATVGLIDKIKSDYKIDSDRIYATGQSMGAMTSMVLASQNPDLFAACMFVDGQWDPTALAPLASQTFCYFAAEDDTSAYNGMQETIPIWEKEGAKIVEKTWDAQWSHGELEEEAQSMLSEDSKIYCIVWESGSIEPKEMGMGGPQGSGSSGGKAGKMDGGGSPQGSGGPQSSGGASSGMSSVGVHMASFDYAYNVNTMVAWTLLQKK